MSEELMKEILAELKSVRKLLENGFGVQAESIQQLGVVDKPAATRRLSISKNDDVMFEEESAEGKWVNSQIKNLCGRLSNLTTRLTEDGKYGRVLYAYLEINADVFYSIRFNSEKNFGRLLVSAILRASHEQLAGIITLSVESGTDWKSTRLPSLTDSLGFKLIGEAIAKDDWSQNKASYLEQASTKIRSARNGSIPMLGNSVSLPAIAPSPSPKSPEDLLRDEVVAQAKSLWGVNEYVEKAKEHSATHFGGLSLKQMTAADMQKYLDDLQEMKRQQ